MNTTAARTRQAQAFHNDLARINAVFEKAGAIVTTDDGFTYIDESKAPKHLLGTYARLTQYGYANGLI